MLHLSKPTHPLRVLTKMLNLTQEAIATDIGCSRATVNRMINKKTRLTDEQAELLSRRYNIGKSWLLEDKVDTLPPDRQGVIRPQLAAWNRVPRPFDPEADPCRDEDGFPTAGYSEWEIEQQSARRSKELDLLIKEIGLPALREIADVLGSDFLHRTTVAYSNFHPNFEPSEWPQGLPTTPDFWTYGKVERSLWEFACGPHLWESEYGKRYDMGVSGSADFKALTSDQQARILNRVIEWEARQAACATGLYLNHKELCTRRVRHTRVWRLVNRIARTWAAQATK